MKARSGIPLCDGEVLHGSRILPMNPLQLRINKSRKRNPVTGSIQEYHGVGFNRTDDAVGWPVCDKASEHSVRTSSLRLSLRFSEPFAVVNRVELLEAAGASRPGKFCFLTGETIRLPPLLYFVTTRS